MEAAEGGEGGRHGAVGEPARADARAAPKEGCAFAPRSSVETLVFVTGMKRASTRVLVVPNRLRPLCHPFHKLRTGHTPIHPTYPPIHPCTHPTLPNTLHQEYAKYVLLLKGNYEVAPTVLQVCKGA